MLFADLYSLLSVFEKIQDSIGDDDDGAHSSHSKQRSSPKHNGHGDYSSFDGNFDGNEVTILI